MAFSTPYTFTALELLTAAKMNAIQTNISAIWTHTTAGDIQYATSSTAATRLGIGTEYKALRVNSGATAPAWEHLHYAVVSHSTTQGSFTTGVAKVLAFDTDTSDPNAWHDPVTNNSRITITKDGYYQASVCFAYAGAGGTGNYYDTVDLKRSGTVIAEDRRYWDISANGKLFAITYPIVSATASQYFEIFLEQNSGGTRTISSGAFFSVMRVA